MVTQTPQLSLETRLQRQLRDIFALNRWNVKVIVVYGLNLLDVTKVHVLSDLTVGKRPGHNYRIGIHFAVFNHNLLYFPL